MRPLAIHHVSINVDDVAACTAFYTETLGGSVRDDRPDFGFGGAWIDLGVTQVHLIEGRPPANLGQHFAIAVEDLDAAVAELRAEDIEVSDPSPVGGGRQAFLQDPSGNLIELHQPG